MTKETRMWKAWTRKANWHFWTRKGVYYFGGEPIKKWLTPKDLIRKMKQGKM